MDRRMKQEHMALDARDISYEELVGEKMYNQTNLYYGVHTEHKQMLDYVNSYALGQRASANKVSPQEAMMNLTRSQNALRRGAIKASFNQQ